MPIIMTIGLVILMVLILDPKQNQLEAIIWMQVIMDC